jgi:ligand-binding SRPBCC domain-containing protein
MTTLLQYLPAMTVININTAINAPIGRCFDLSRSVELHMLSTASTGERAIAGRTTGLAEQGDTITWLATHFGIRQQLTTKIEKMVRPHFFSDRMLFGAFKSLCHEHLFEERDGHTLMTDKLCYETPLGIFGSLFDRLVLEKHMKHFLQERNQVIKKAAEGDMWKEILKAGS